MDELGCHFQSPKEEAEVNRECICGIYLGPIRNFGPFYSIRLFRSFCPFPFHSNFKPKEKKKSIFDKWPRPGIHSINFHSISNLWLTLSVPTRTAQKSLKLSHSPTLLQHTLFSFFNFFAFHHSLFLSLSLRLVQEKKKKKSVCEKEELIQRERNGEWRYGKWSYRDRNPNVRWQVCTVQHSRKPLPGLRQLRPSDSTRWSRRLRHRLVPFLYYYLIFRFLFSFLFFFCFCSFYCIFILILYLPSFLFLLSLLCEKKKKKINRYNLIPLAPSCLDDQIKAKSSSNKF